MKLVSTAVIRKEMREILRDRRAIVLSFLLPIFIYPATFSFTSWLERKDSAKAEEEVATVVVRGPFAIVREAIGQDEHLKVVDTVPEADPEVAVAEGHYDVWIELGDPGEEGELPELRLLYHAPREESRGARDRILDLLE
ncbi:hypothetical protein K8I85_13205, partial [bacterium]|nr:hypothetical protein [bacterium]